MVASKIQGQIRKNLVDDLAARLRGTLSVAEPYIVQDRIPQTRSRHIVVIWDKWRDLEREFRSSIIADAFDAAGALGGDTIRVALGLTQQEAFEMGFLPFTIESLVRDTDPVTPAKIRKALDSIGGVRVKTGAASQLRYPSREYADEAYRQLTSKIPGPYWAIVQEGRLASD